LYCALHPPVTHKGRISAPERAYRFVGDWAKS